MLREDPSDLLQDVGRLAREVVGWRTFPDGSLATWPLTKIMLPQLTPCENGPASRQCPGGALTARDSRV